MTWPWLPFLGKGPSTAAGAVQLSFLSLKSEHPPEVLPGPGTRRVLGGVRACIPTGAGMKTMRLRIPRSSAKPLPKAPWLSLHVDSLAGAGWAV